MFQPQRLRDFLFFFLLLSSGGFPVFAQSSPSSSSATPLYSVGPVTDYSVALPNLSEVIRFRRGERYNNPVLALPELGEDSEPALWTLPETHFRKDPMPFGEGVVVVTGTITAGQAYLSNDKQNIYSEFKLKVQAIVKAPNRLHLRAGDSIDLQRRGGAIRLPSGKVLVRGNLPDSMPEVGKRYLLFLKDDANTEDYGVLTGYQLDGNEVYGLDDLSFDESHHEKEIHPLRKEGVNEEQFFECVKGKVARKDGAAD